MTRYRAENTANFLSVIRDNYRTEEFLTEAYASRTLFFLSDEALSLFPAPRTRSPGELHCVWEFFFDMSIAAGSLWPC